MSQITRTAILCDGVTLGRFISERCSMECQDEILIGWITIHGPREDYHLCAHCSTPEGIRKVLDRTARERLDLERGDD